jgi:hypothetical protein
VTQVDLLRYLVETLEGVGVPYMVGGSHAAKYYGEPRLTRDVDVVVALSLDRLPALLEQFPAGEFYVDAEAARAFAIDVLACVHCGGRLRLIATLHDPAVIRKILAHRRALIATGRGGQAADLPPLAAWRRRSSGLIRLDA